MARNTPVFEVGDAVAYSVQWLRSVGMSQSDAAHGRATVTDVKPFGDAVLAALDVTAGTMAERVLTANLAKVGPNTRFAQC